jgi:type IV secretion system protein VirB4
MSRTYITTGAAKVLAPREANVGDRLPYAGHLDEVTLQTRDGLLIQTLHLAGFPSETAPDDELNYRKAIRETVLRGAASSRLAIYHHVVRRRVTPAFPEAPEEAFCARLDAGWRERLAGRRLYVNDIFLTLVRRPLQGGAGFLERLVRQPGAKSADLSRELRAPGWRISRSRKPAPPCSGRRTRVRKMSLT